ncbi:MAG: hypothetical protein JSU01_15360 [Bacteroidetes bacterium]|nr:hypothetical protein [Bacteroidota bacterium]
MTTLKVTVEDEKADQLKELLWGIAFVKNVEAEQSTVESVAREPKISYARLKKILASVKDKDLFKDIEDPSEWQRQIRKEWDRDL